MYTFVIKPKANTRFVTTRVTRVRVPAWLTALSTYAFLVQADLTPLFRYLPTTVFTRFFRARETIELLALRVVSYATNSVSLTAQRYRDRVSSRANTPGVPWYRFEIRIPGYRIDTYTRRAPLHSEEVNRVAPPIY